MCGGCHISFINITTVCIETSVSLQKSIHWTHYDYYHLEYVFESTPLWLWHSYGMLDSKNENSTQVPNWISLCARRARKQSPLCYGPLISQAKIRFSFRNPVLWFYFFPTAQFSNCNQLIVMQLCKLKVSSCIMTVQYFFVACKCGILYCCM